MCFLTLVGFFQIYTQEWNCWIMLLCLVAHSCLFWDPMDCSLPGSSVHGDSAGKNTGVSCHALLPTQGSNPGLLSCITGGFSTSWATREAQEYWSGYPIPSPGDLPDPGIELGFPTLREDSLSTELHGKPLEAWSLNRWTGREVPTSTILWLMNHVHVF